MKLIGYAVAVIAVVFLAFSTSEAANVALFFNSSYVDTAANFSGEAYTVQQTLLSQGHAVSTFTGITATDFNNAVVGNTVLAIPELESGDLNADLDSAARTAIANFVNSGGTFVGFSGAPNMINLMNAVFGFSLTSSSNSPYALNGAGAAGTTFAGGPASLGDPSATEGVSQASLPPGTRRIYSNSGSVAVFIAPYGSGQVIFLAWDWYNALPVGIEDGGWLSVLNSAVTAGPFQMQQSIPTMSEWGMIIFMVLAGLGSVYFLRRQKRTES